MPRRAPIALAALLLAAAPAAAQRATVEQYVDRNQGRIVAELVELLKIPNVAADSANIRRNATALEAMMARRGIRTRRIETGGPPMVFGELLVPGATTTLLLYAHYDGQPVNPEHWVGHAPWEPILRAGKREAGAATIPFPADGRYDPEWRIYARSASDDKSPIVGILAALDALTAAGRRPR